MGKADGIGVSACRRIGDGKVAEKRQSNGALQDAIATDDAAGRKRGIFGLFTLLWQGTAALRQKGLSGAGVSGIHIRQSPFIRKVER